MSVRVCLVSRWARGGEGNPFEMTSCLWLCFLQAEKGEEGEEGEEGEGWGDEDDDLDLDIELEEPEGEGEGTGDIFVAPSAGTSQSQMWVNNSSLVADHVAAGSFDTAMNVRLLHHSRCLCRARNSTMHKQEFVHAHRRLHTHIHIHIHTHAHEHAHMHMHIRNADYEAADGHCQLCTIQGRVLGAVRALPRCCASHNLHAAPVFPHPQKLAGRWCPQRLACNWPQVLCACREPPKCIRLDHKGQVLRCSQPDEGNSSQPAPPCRQQPIRAARSSTGMCLSSRWVEG